MKRCAVLFIGLIAFSLSALIETKTIGDVDFSAIKQACNLPANGGDELINHYYEDCFNLSGRSRDEWEDEVDDRNDFQTGNYGINAMVGAIGNVDGYCDDIQADILLDDCYGFLLNPDNPNGYLSIADVIAHAENGNVMDAFYTLYNLAFITDMIWEYDSHGYDTQGDYQTALHHKLHELASWVHGFLYPDINERGNACYVYYGILGYAGLVLEKENYINLADSKFDDCFSNAYQESGIFREGLHYRSFAYINSTYYFTARERYNGDLNVLYYGDNGYLDYYQKESLIKSFEESIYLYCPDLSFMNFDDCWKTYGGSFEDENYFQKWLFFPYGLLEFYYQTDNASIEFENFITFYFNERQNCISGTGYDKPLIKNLNKISFILSYESDRETIQGSSIIPSKIKSPNYSNEEFTVLRDSLSSVEEFRNNIAVWVNHENSESYRYGHEQGDQTSFSLYYKGRNLTLS